MIAILPHTRAAITDAIVKDLSASQSTADSIAQRIKITTDLCEQICTQLVTQNKLETLTIAQTLTVYRLK